MNIPYLPRVEKDPNFFDKPTIILLILLAVSLFFGVKSCRADITPPDNFWQGLVAEDTSGDYQTYLVIASVVRNRLLAGMTPGLVALNKKNLEHFVWREVKWASWHDIDLVGATNSAINEVFEEGKDYAFGATHYEHTGVYSTPKWAKKMKLVKVLNPGTKREISLWRKSA